MIDDQMLIRMILAETDPDQELSLELRRRSEELEKLAKGVRKNIKRL